MKASLVNQIWLSGKMVMATSGLALSGFAYGSTPETIGDIQFVDPNFADCFSGYEASSPNILTELDCSNNNISSVEEIKYFPVLEDLILLNNNIKSVDTTNNPKLKRLILANNQLTDIDLSHNPELETLTVSENNLTQLNINKNLKLKSLYAYKMPIAEIDIRHLSRLRDLGFSAHKLTELNVSQNSELKTLFLGSGSLTTIDLSHNPKLSHVSLQSNQLQEIDLSKNANLKHLNVRNNKLTSLDLSQQTQLQEVKADYNQLAEFQLGKNPNLTSLELNNNKLTKLDLTQQLALKKFIAFNNPLYDITLAKGHEFVLFSVEGSPYAAALTTTSQASEEKNISNLLSPRVSIIEGGVITQEGKEYTVTPTQMVMPKLGQYIGFRYSVTLPKNAQGEVEPSLAKTNKFPITVRMTHPKIVDPKTGKGFTESTWPDTMFKHDRNLAMWYFGDKSELVSGRWQLEILYRDSVVAKKAFQLVNMDDPKELTSIKEALVMQNLFSKGSSYVCKETAFQRCFGFDSTSKCEQALEPYTESCQSLMAREIKKQKDKFDSKDALKNAFLFYTGCLMGTYAEKNHFERTEVLQCMKSK
ncbi:TPA: leucine-rich repeat domain-containing protein [Vibrio campbellii]